MVPRNVGARSIVTSLLYVALISGLVVQVRCHPKFFDYDESGNGDVKFPRRYTENDVEISGHRTDNDVKPSRRYTYNMRQILHDVASLWGHNPMTSFDSTTTTTTTTTVANRTKCASKLDYEDFMTQRQRLCGGLLVHFVIGLYVCVAMGVLCDYYFVPSLEIICYHLNIQEDVGGATLMCIGSSAPDIFSGIIAILFVEGDLGVGTAMGTTVFNLLFVVGVTGVVAYQSFVLPWWPLCRDMTAYGVSVITLTGVTMDGYVTLWEASLMVAMYVAYFILLWFNRPLEKKIYLLLKDEVSMEQRFEDVVMKKALLDIDIDMPASDKEVQVDEDTEEKLSVSSSDIDQDYCGYPTDPPIEPLTVPEDTDKAILWFLLLPVSFLFFLTIPDLRRRKCQKLVSVTFIASILWIGVLTFVLLRMVNTIGHTFGFPGNIMGITLVTFGTSVPDLLCSIIVIRRGRASMAISQCIAANPLGILIGMGLPWLLKIAVVEHRPVFIGHDMLNPCVVALGLVLFAQMLFVVRKFVLDRKIGVVFTIGYVLYIVGSVCYAVFVTCRQAL